MKKYIGVKEIQATPMTRGEYNKHRGWTLPADENGEDEGYLKDDGNGHQQWDPKEVFDKAYFEVSGGSKINIEDVDRFMGEVTATQIDPKTTLVSCNSLTGFTQHATSPCVDPANYDEALGKKYGTEKLRDAYWHCLGFVLQWAKNGLNK
jgi:hypothetical protein